MSKIASILLLVCASGQICGSQIFGGQLGRPPRGGGIIDHGHGQARGGILGGHGVGPGGREGIFAMSRDQQAPSRSSRKDRVRMGPIVFDSEHLEHDDNDDYSDDHNDDHAYQRPRLGLDLSTLFVPLFNFFKLTGKSFEALFCLLEKQANLLLGRNMGNGGSVSVTIVIIVSWLVIGLVVYALAQFAILRQMRQEEEEASLEDAPPALFQSAPILQMTPPSPGSGIDDDSTSDPAIEGSVLVNKSAIWLPSVGALKLSESSILKRRESRKKKKGKEASSSSASSPCRRNKPKASDDRRIRHRTCDVDDVTLAWIEQGLDRMQEDPLVKSNILLKWNNFVKQHMMQSIKLPKLHIDFEELVTSKELPKLANIDVEMSDQDNLIIRVDIEAAFEADLRKSDDNNLVRLSVSKLETRLELKLARREVEDETLHIRQTGHVVVEATLSKDDDSLLDILKRSLINALKNVDCDLPPMKDLINPAKSSSENSAVFVESPCSFAGGGCSSSSSSRQKNDSTDSLHVSLLRATLDETPESCCHFHPYVILEVDHPAQRFRTKASNRQSRGQKADYTWPNDSKFVFQISREKTVELLVELWEPCDHAEQDHHQQSDQLACCCNEGNLSPGAVGHRFLGLGLFSVRDLMSTPSQSHVVSLQGRPFEEQDDSVLNWTINLKFDYVPDDASTSIRASPFVTMVNGVHKTLEIRQGSDSGQPCFMTNATYQLKDTNLMEENDPSHNAVALAAVRDLQTQQNLRLGAPLATKSVLLIKAVLKTDTKSMSSKTPELVTPTNCDVPPPADHDQLETSQEEKLTPLPAPPAAEKAKSPTMQQDKKPRRRGFLANLRDRFNRKSSTASSCNVENKTSEISADLSSSNEKDISDCSSCSSSCCTEQSYQLSAWKGPLSSSWQSLASTSSTLMVPYASLASAEADASSLSDASGISLNSSFGINNTTAAGNGSSGTPPPLPTPAVKKNLTALILETVEEHGLRAHYLIPKQFAKKARLLRRKGLKLHVSNEHLFLSKHIKSGTNCSVCQKKIVTRLGKKCYVCRDCGLTCHKGCFDRTTDSCSQSSLDSMELKYFTEEKDDMTSALIFDGSAAEEIASIRTFA